MGLSTHKGDIGEMEVAADLLKRGFQVFRPISSDCRYDLVALKDGRFYRVQCKYYAGNGETVKLRCRRTGQSHVTLYTADMVDWMAVYDATLDRCFYVAASYLGPNGRNEFTIRVAKHRHRNQHHLHRAEDFSDPPVAAGVL